METTTTDRTAATALASTAHWTAAARALETARVDGLFRDPWAEALAGTAGRAWIEQRPAGSVLPMVLRTRYFDDWLRETVDGGAIRQVVLPAAGLDTRAWRLPWPAGTRWFELDRAELLGMKQDVLAAAGTQPGCDRRAVEADLTGPWPDALVAAGYDPGSPSAWLLEGFLFYLAPSAVDVVLDRVTTLACAGSRLGFDIVNGAMLTSPWTKQWVDMQAAAGAPWIGTMEDPADELAIRGWRAALTQAGQPDANYGRWELPVLPTDAPGMPHNWFVTAVRAG